MGCGNGSNGGNDSMGINSYYDLQNTCPKSPLDLIANASINGTAGSLANSTTYGSETWTDVGTLVTMSSKPTITTLGGDSSQNVADAQQWNFSHLTGNLAATVAIPLRKTIFLRAGTNWQNRITLANSATIQDPQLSFLMNAATRGDKQGTIPVISWSGGSYTVGTFALDVVVKHPGNVRMGFWFISGGAYYMFDMEWIIVK
jgi:hypothetical protein